MPRDAIRLSADGRTAGLGELVNPHLQVIGASGSGKSRFLELLARRIVDSGAPLVLLDGKGDLYRSLAAYCAHRRLADRTALLDPADPGFAVGLNYLEAFGGAPYETVAANALMGLKKASGESLTFQPTLEEWAPATFQALAAAGFTLLDALAFIRLSERAFRDRVLGEIGERWPSIPAMWRELLATHRGPDAAAELASLRRRLSRLDQSANLRAIFGQTRTTIDWMRAMRRGIVLAQLGVGQLPESDGRLIGVAILHQLRTVAPLRPAGDRRPCYVMIDECQRFVTKDLAEALDELRGYGVRLILAHQHLAQLRRTNEPDMETLYHAMLANTAQKVVFGVSAEDAEILAPELFRVRWRADRVKDEIAQTKFRPTYTREKVYAEAEHEATSRSRTRAVARGTSSGSGWTSGRQSGGSWTYPGDPDAGVAYTDSRVDSWGDSGFSGDSYSESEAESESETRGASRGVGDVPFLLPVEFRELTSRAFHSPEDLKMLAAGILQAQEPRRAFVRLKRSEGAFAVHVPHVEPVRVSERELARFKARVMPKCARPRAEVADEIARRVAAYLEEATPTLPESGASAEPAEGPQETRSWSTTVKPSFEGPSPRKPPSKRPRKARTPGGEG